MCLLLAGDIQEARTSLTLICPHLNNADPQDIGMLYALAAILNVSIVKPLRIPPNIPDYEARWAALAEWSISDQGRTLLADTQ